MLVWLSVWSKVQTCIWPSWCHCYSLSLASVKSRLVLPFCFLVPAHLGSPGKRAIKQVCVCVCQTLFSTLSQHRQNMQGRKGRTRTITPTTDACSSSLCWVSSSLACRSATSVRRRLQSLAADLRASRSSIKVAICTRRSRSDSWIHHARTHTHKNVQRPFVQDYPG